MKQDYRTVLTGYVDYHITANHVVVLTFKVEGIVNAASSYDAFATAERRLIDMFSNKAGVTVPVIEGFSVRKAE